MFRAKIATTFSHAVPSLGSHPNRREKALARDSDRWNSSDTEYVRPVRAHVNGFRLSDTGHRPRSSRLMNSAIDIESGGAVARINTTSLFVGETSRVGYEPIGSSGTHLGG